MDLDDIELFLELCRSQNLTATANNLYITQPTVSRRLAALECELGFPLLTRGKGYDSVSLTPAGKRFFSIAQQMSLLDKEAHALRACADVRHLSIGATDSIASFPLRDFFHAVAQEQKTWNIDLTISDSLEIFEMVAKRSIDVGLTNGPSPLAESVSIPVFQEDFVVMRRGVRPESSRAVHPGELKEDHEIFQIFSNEYHHWHSTWWPSGTPKCRVNLAQFTVAFLTAPEDWTILPCSVAQALLPSDGFLSPLLESPPKRKCFMVRHKKPRRDRQDTIYAFQAKLLDYAAQILCEQETCMPLP